MTATVPTQAPPTVAGSTKPMSVDDLPSYLEAFLPTEAKGQVELIPTKDGTTVSALFTIANTANQRTLARKYARDFIFGAYATRLQLRAASVTITQPSGAPGLAVYLGGGWAASKPQSTWTNNTITPGAFIDWMMKAADVNLVKFGSEGTSIDGPWAN